MWPCVSVCVCVCVRTYVNVRAQRLCGNAGLLPHACTASSNCRCVLGLASMRVRVCVCASWNMVGTRHPTLGKPVALRGVLTLPHRALVVAEHCPNISNEWLGGT